MKKIILDEKDMINTPSPRSLAEYSTGHKRNDLTDDIVREAFNKYQSGATLRELGEEYKCSYEYFRRKFKQMAGHVPSVLGRRLMNENIKDFIEMVQGGITPHIAAKMFKVDKVTFEDMLTNNEDFRAAVEAAEAKHLSVVEAVIAAESKENWKAALEVITRNKHTRDDWKNQEKQETNNTIAIQVNWDRDA